MHPNNQNQFHQLDNWIKERTQAYRTTSMSIALFDGHHIHHEAQFGLADPIQKIPVTPSTLFAIGSIGKVFTAIAILQQIENGSLDLQSPVVEILPWFRVNSSFDPINIKQLLTHSAGLISGTDFSPNAQGEIWGLLDISIVNPPGSKFHYSNIGYKILGLILEEITSQPYHELIQRDILQPLEMRDSYSQIIQALRPQMAQGFRSLYDDRPAHSSHTLVPAEWVETNTADGSIISTARDMAKFGQMLLNSGTGINRIQILSEEGYHLLTGRLMTVGENHFYGFGLYTFEENGVAYCGHGGDIPGYEAYLWLDLDNKLGVTLLESTPHAPMVSFHALDYLSAAIQGIQLPQTPSVPDRIHITDMDLNKFVGNYSLVEDENTSTDSPKFFEIRSIRTSLHLIYQGNDITLEEHGNDCFLVPHPDFSLFILEFGRAHQNTGLENEARVVEAFHGNAWYTHESYSGIHSFESPSEWSAYIGHYRAHNPWLSNFRVVLRKGSLFLIESSGDILILEPREEACFQIGKELSPERLQFDQIVDGQAFIVNRSGGIYYRFFTP